MNVLLRTLKWDWTLGGRIMPLNDLFPTLPPTGYLSAFDQQILSYNPSLVGENPDPNAFFFVVIDGPPSAVNTLDPRDESYVQFITKRVQEAETPQVAHFICMNDSPNSNCDDIHQGGVEGTILRMPDDMGFANWAVAHSVREISLTIPNKLIKRAPVNAKVWELEYSYDFTRAKRDEGDIYFRVDYSDSHTYYTDVVQAAHQKRNMEPRFWIGDDRHGKGCNGPDGFLKVNLAGSMRNTMRFGFTLVGTIQPFTLEEAYGYFDSDIYMSGQLDFDGKGILDISNRGGSVRSLFPSPISRFQASHPGIVSFSPELNAEISLIGSGEIDGKFSVGFEAGSSKTMNTHAPPGLGSFGGDILTDTLNNAANGFMRTNNSDFDTVFAMNMNLEATMNMKIFGYQTSLEDVAARFTARTPHAIRVVGNTGDGKAGVLDAPSKALRTSSKLAPLIQPNPPFRFKREYLEPLTQEEIKRFVQIEPRAGPSSGSSNTYRIYEYSVNTNGPTNYFEFTTPPYPAGDNGDALDEETGRNERYALNDPGNYEDTSITSNGILGINFFVMNSDDPIDRATFPNHGAEFVQSGELDLEDGQGTIYRTQLPLFSFVNLLNYFAADYRTWVPPSVELNPPLGSAAGDVAEAMGSTNNPTALVNLERDLNVLKGRIYTAQGRPTAENLWDEWMTNVGQSTAEAAISSLRAVFVVMNYIRDIENFRQQVFDDRNAVLEQFDDLYG
ncbi:hypothetical protein F4810DRAFT_715319 [Camillea tinctor]|nr:hypothetical protein F4810DRAFT_715319 [Camillea tinctor]